MWSPGGDLLWTLGDYDHTWVGHGFFYSGDGRFLLVAHGGGQVARVVDAVTGRVAQRLAAKWGEGRWSADSRRIFTLPTMELDWKNPRYTTWERPRDGADWAVYVVDGDRARKTIVRIEHQAGQEAEVTSGLSEGARVVEHPGDTLTDGALIVERPAA